MYGNGAASLTTARSVSSSSCKDDAKETGTAPVYGSGSARRGLVLVRRRYQAVLPRSAATAAGRQCCFQLLDIKLTSSLTQNDRLPLADRATRSHLHRPSTSKVPVIGPDQSQLKVEQRGNDKTTEAEIHIPM